MAGQKIGPNGNATNQINASVATPRQLATTSDLVATRGLLPVGRRVGGSLLIFRGYPGAKNQSGCIT
jgi:hypothetical protein